MFSIMPTHVQPKYVKTNIMILTSTGEWIRQLKNIREISIPIIKRERAKTVIEPRMSLRSPTPGIRRINE